MSRLEPANCVPRCANCYEAFLGKIPEPNKNEELICGKCADPAQVQPAVMLRRCSGCGLILGAEETSVYMRYGIYCVPCAENRGAFDRFQPEEG